LEKRVKIIVKGFVQGVGFRYFTLKKAEEFKIFGTVQNLNSGEVEVDAQGENGLLNDFISELRKGPLKGSVSNLNIEELPLKNFIDFRII